jgi:hypothetical protein
VIAISISESEVFKMAAQARTAAEPHPITYVDFLTVTLTALCALLAALAIFIAVAAIYGYLGIREEITKSIAKQADEALKAKLGEYPDSKDVLGLFEKMQTFHEQQKLLSDQLVADSGSKTIAEASKQGEDKPKRRSSLARDYPGKGK